jgi:hypothetical protein
MDAVENVLQIMELTATRSKEHRVWLLLGLIEQILSELLAP